MPSTLIRIRPGGPVISSGGGTPRLIAKAPPEDIAPTAIDDTAAVTTNDGTVLIDVLANDAGSAPLILTAAVIASGSGSVAINANQIAFTVPGSAGTTVITYTVANGAGSDTGSLTITISDVGVAPTAIDDSASVAPSSVTLLNVTADDTGTPPITLDSANVVSGSGSVAIVSGQIQFTAPGAAGTTEIDYVISNAFGSDTGTLTVTIEDQAVAPEIGQTAGFASTANLTSFQIANGLTTPANCKAVVVFVFSFMDFNAATDPEAITAVPLTYGGTAMTRVDGYGNQFYRDRGPAIFTYVLNTDDGDTIPASGNMDWSITISGAGKPEVLGARWVFVTHPSDDVVFSVLNEAYEAAQGLTVNSAFTANDASLVINASGFKGQGGFTGDGADWAEVGRQIMTGSNAATSGGMVVEQRTFETGAADTHTLTSGTSNYRSTITVQFQGQGAGSQTAPTAVDDTANAVTSGPTISVDVLANDSGDGTLTLQSPTIVSGGGSVAISGNQVMFTPPSSAGTTEIDYTVASLFGSDVGRLTVTTSDPTAPTAVDDTGSTAQGQIPVLFDVLANDTGAAPLTIDSVTIVSGGGVAEIFDNQIQYTPPAGAGTAEIDYVVENVAGSDTGRLTVTFSDVSAGPLVGPAIGLGQNGESLAAIDTAINDFVDNTIRPNLVTLNGEHAAKGEAQIRSENPGFVDLTGTTGAALVAAINAGSTKLFLTNQTYNWSDLAAEQLTPTGGLELVGLPGNDVIIGGTALNVGQRRWFIRGDLRVEGVNARDGAVWFSFIGLTSTVDSVIFRYNTFDNVGCGLPHHELPIAVSPNMRVNNLIVQKNICTNVRDGMNLRLGIGGNNDNGIIVNLTVEDNIVDNWTRYSLACHYDNPPSGLVYNFPESFGAWRRNLVQNSPTMDGNGFSLSAGSFEDHIFEENWIVNNSRGGSGFDAESMYAKAAAGIWRNNVVWNSGQNDNQGMIAGKGEPGLNGDVLGELLVENNFVGSNLTDTDSCIWFQRSNMNVRRNTIIFGQDIRAVSGQSSDPYQGGKFFDNYIRILSTNGNSGIQVFGDLQDFSYGGNNWISETASAHTIYRIVSDNSVSSRTIDNPSFDGDIFDKQGSGAVTAYLIERRTAQINNVSIRNADFLNSIDIALRTIDGTLTTPITWTGHDHTGTAPSVQNNVGATVNTLGSGGGNSF